MIAPDICAGLVSMIIPVFYINRDCDLERRAHVENELAKLRIDATRIPAVEGRSVPDWLTSFYDTTLSPGEVGCSASHLIIYSMIRDQNLGFAVILEDDAKLAPDFMETVSEAIRAAPSHWDIIRLTHTGKAPLQTLARTSTDRSLVRYTKIPVGTAGLIVSGSGARQLLQPRLIKAAIDVEIRNPWHLDLNVFGIAPPVVSTVSVNEMPSTIPLRSRARIGARHSSMPRRVVFNFRTMGFFAYMICFCGRFLPLSGP